MERGSAAETNQAWLSWKDFTFTAESGQLRVYMCILEMGV